MHGQGGEWKGKSKSTSTDLSCKEQVDGKKFGYTGWLYSRKYNGKCLDGWSETGCNEKDHGSTYGILQCRKPYTTSPNAASPPTQNVSKPKGTLCARLFEDANYDGTQYPIYTAVDATKDDQVVLTVNDLKSTYGVKGLTSIVVEPGFGINLYTKKYLDGEVGWARGRHSKVTRNDQYQSMRVYYNSNW